MELKLLEMFQNLGTPSENVVAVATGNFPEIQTGIFGQMESSPCLESQKRRVIGLLPFESTIEQTTETMPLSLTQ